MALNELRVLVLVGLLAAATVGVGLGTGVGALAAWGVRRWRQVVSGRAASARPQPEGGFGLSPGDCADAGALVLRRQAWWRLRC